MAGAPRRRCRGSQVAATFIGQLLLLALQGDYPIRIMPVPRELLNHHPSLYVGHRNDIRELLCSKHISRPLHNRKAV